MDLEELARFILASEARMGTMEILGREDAIPSEISIKLNMQPPQVSRALRELEERELIKCLTPETKKGKIYTLTDIGYHVRRSFNSFLEEKFRGEIMEALDEKKITYARNIILKGRIEEEYSPDLVILSHEEPVLTVEVLGWRLSHPYDLVDPFFLDPLKCRAFKSHDIKKSYKIKTGIGLIIISKAKTRTSEILLGIRDKIEKFVEEGYFDYIFYNDKIDDFISYVEELTHS